MHIAILNGDSLNRPILRFYIENFTIIITRSVHVSYISNKKEDINFFSCTNIININLDSHYLYFFFSYIFLTKYMSLWKNKKMIAIFLYETDKTDIKENRNIFFNIRYII